MLLPSPPLALRCGSSWMVAVSMAESELLDESPVRLQVASLEVCQEPAAGTDHLEQPPPAVVILGVGAEVIGERVDALGEKRNLHTGVARIAVVLTELADELLLAFLCQCHVRGQR